MADAKRRDDWDRTATLMSTLGKVMGGEWVDPKRYNPFHVDPPKTPEQERMESRQAFQLLGLGLRAMVGRG